MKKSIFLLALLPLLGACSSNDTAPAPDAFSDPNKTLSEVVRKLPADEALANKCINDIRTSGGSLEGYTIASLPYKNYSTRPYLILPPEGTEISEATAHVFEEGFFDSLKKSMKSVKLNLALPKINIAASLETNNLFEALGISKRGSFNSLGWHGEPLDVLAAQDIALQWDEEGTKFAAASVTDLVLGLTTGTQE